MKYGATAKGEDPKYRKIFRNISRPEWDVFQGGRMFQGEEVNAQIAALVAAL